MEEEKSLLNFALFVAFFPQLVAGPIERASHLLPQIRKPKPLTAPDFQSGMYLVGWGLFKKVVLADNAAIVVDQVFSATEYSGLASLVGVYAFALQIYCDFSAYSDIARGAARCLGYDLMLNFNLPYFAKSPSDFWQRWHISLSSWLRDYLYIPLGGNRKGSRRTYINLMLTMLLGGLWHGAGWTFVAWGLYHGLLLILYRYFSKPAASPRDASKGFNFINILFYFHLTCISWLLFRAENISQAGEMFVSIFTVFRLDPLLLSSAFMQFYMVAAIIFAMQLLQYLTRDLDIVLKLPVPIRAGMYLFGILWFILFGEYGGTAFIYFQF